MNLTRKLNRASFLVSASMKCPLEKGRVIKVAHINATHINHYYDKDGKQVHYGKYVGFINYLSEALNWDFE